MRADEARNYLDRATARVVAEDRHLLEVNVSEWCIAARLAMYLREYFWDFDVDVEYNRDGDEVKRLHDVVRDCPRDRDDGHPVLPDVIVHRRGLRGDSNLLVIEMKKDPGEEGHGLRPSAHQGIHEGARLQVRSVGGLQDGWGICDFC